MVVKLIDGEIVQMAAMNSPHVAAVGACGALLHVHRDSSASGYATVLTVPRDGTLSPLAFPDLQLPVATIVG